MKSEKKKMCYSCLLSDSIENEIIACFIDSRFPTTYNCMNGTFILFTFEIFFNFCIQKFSLGKLRMANITRYVLLVGPQILS